METVLYKYHFNYFSFILCAIPLIIGGILLWLIIDRIYKKKTWSITFFSKIFTIGLTILSCYVVLVSAVDCIWMISTHFSIKEKLNNDNVYIAEGYVEDFYQNPNGDNDYEHFIIDNVYFEYSEYGVMNGYNKYALNGGVITHNGQHLKIKYIVNELSGKFDILYIAELE